VEVIGRLFNLGIDKDTLRENLRFSAAQRLLPKLCTSCAEQAPKDVVEASLSKVGSGANFSEAAFRIKNEMGCPKCHQGIMGRVPAIEYLTKNEIIAYVSDFINRSKPVQSLQDAAFRFAIRGDIDVREVKDIG
jgi:type II secretory ATPase GspE/PulE/Tfp pilus assembly ATPase PilB-like protein